MLLYSPVEQYLAFLDQGDQTAGTGLRGDPQGDAGDGAALVLHFVDVAADIFNVIDAVVKDPVHGIELLLREDVGNLFNTVFGAKLIQHVGEAVGAGDLGELGVHGVVLGAGLELHIHAPMRELGLGAGVLVEVTDLVFLRSIRLILVQPVLMMTISPLRISAPVFITSSGP